MIIQAIQKILIKRGKKIKIKKFVKVLFFQLKEANSEENFASTVKYNQKIILKPLKKQTVQKNKKSTRICAVIQKNQTKNFIQIFSQIKNKDKNEHFYNYFTQVNKKQQTVYSSKKSEIQNLLSLCQL